MSTSDLAREVDFHRDRVAQLEVERDELKLQLTEAEATRLNLEWKLGEAKAALVDAKGVVTAAEAWRDWFPHVDSMFAPENTLIAAVNAFKGKARVGAPGAQELPSFGSPCICGTTGHEYGSQVVYELNADAECPVHGEQAEASACSRCGGLEGTHTRRDCGQANRDEAMVAAATELFRAGIVPGACPACGSTASAHLCSTDEVAVELETLQHLTKRRDGDDV